VHFKIACGCPIEAEGASVVAHILEKAAEEIYPDVPITALIY